MRRVQPTVTRKMGGVPEAGCCCFSRSSYLARALALSLSLTLAEPAARIVCGEERSVECVGDGWLTELGGGGMLLQQYMRKFP